MVKIAVAAPGQVASEIIEGLVATGKHEIILLARRDPRAGDITEGVTWNKVDFSNKESLTSILSGVHTVLSFVMAHTDENSVSQKTLIDASIAAGVKRFAPSEWFIANYNVLSWYYEKLRVREYLEEVNKDKKVLEYTLFQPGMFTDYFANVQTNKYVVHNNFLPWDFDNRSIFSFSGKLDGRLTATSVKDMVNIVAKAVEYEGEWPKVGGIAGDTVTLAEILDLGKKIRGGNWKVINLDLDALKRGELDDAYVRIIDHPALANLDEASKLAFSKNAFIGFLLAISDPNECVVSNEWNGIFPDYKFTTVEEYVSKFWAGKP
ncbi:hypothetical protein QBC35DRAFT_505117 [Podospora australis]|uniref:NmrA-like domain-containing protein n=1 Tax=Podospora australis TaxID=1536484 RepID=A0AAN7AFL8_9PEZI|nr:hypothetical protein QBC35DRAFT_505117 [Podospora australis]